MYLHKPSRLPAQDTPHLLPGMDNSNAGTTAQMPTNTACRRPRHTHRTDVSGEIGTRVQGNSCRQGLPTRVEQGRTH